MSTRLQTTHTVALNAGRPRRALAAFGLLGLLVGVPIFLHAIAGPPRLPARLPSWLELQVILRGPELPLGAVAYLAAMAAWLAWGYLALSIGLQIAALVAETVSSGQWVRALRRVADRLTAPVVRQLVEALFVALVVVHLAGRAPAVNAASAGPVAAAVVPLSSVSSAETAEPAQSASSNTIAYTVQSGDTLWDIAQHYYGTGWEFQRLVAANTGRQMSDGRAFTDAGHIYPGWTLHVPLPSTAVDDVNGQVFYTVEPGDTLSGIAARLLGDENRWHEIFDLNNGVARLDGGQVIHQANLIWPGLRLRLPLTVVPPARPPTPPQPAPPPRVEVPPASVSPSPEPSPSPVLPSQPPAEQPAAVAAARPAAPAAWQPLTKPLEAAAIAAAGVAGVTLLARRRVRRSMAEPPTPIPPESDVVIADGFAEAEPQSEVRASREQRCADIR